MCSACVCDAIVYQLLKPGTPWLRNKLGIWRPHSTAWFIWYSRWQAQEVNKHCANRKTLGSQPEKIRRFLRTTFRLKIDHPQWRDSKGGPARTKRLSEKPMQLCKRCALVQPFLVAKHTIRGPCLPGCDISNIPNAASSFLQALECFGFQLTCFHPTLFLAWCSWALKNLNLHGWHSLQCHLE